jgi:hypothetical protein
MGRVAISLGILALVFGLKFGFPEEQWTPLFNGKDLTGWIPKIRLHPLGDNYNNTFRVEDGLLKVRYDGYGHFNQQFGHLFYQQPYSKYKLRIVYRFVGDQCTGGPKWAIRNSGLMLHCQDPATMGLEQKYPVSLEGQLLGGDGKNKRTTGNLCTPGTNVVMDGKLHTTHCKNSASGTFHGDQWVRMEVEVHGSQLIRHFINGALVMSYSEPQYDPGDVDAKLLADQAGKLLIDQGFISLQSESHPIDFRKIEILVLE